MNVSTGWVLGEATTRTYFDLARLHSMTQWWHWMVLVGICLTMVSFVYLIYRRDTVELSAETRWLLFLLRVLTLVGLLVFFLDLEKRTERKLVKNSRVAVLVDTSQSMGLVDAGASESRLRQVVQEISTGPLLSRLRQKHDVTVYRFDQASAPTQIVSLSKTAARNAQAGNDSENDQFARSLGEAGNLWRAAALVLGFSALAGLAHVLFRNVFAGAEGESWAILVCVLSLIVAVVIAAVANLRRPEISPAVALGFRLPDRAEKADAADKVPTDTSSRDDDENVDWANQLTARGHETRLGQALRWIVEKERGGPFSGIVVFTDGCNNAGVELDVAVDLAQESEIPVHTVGIGSETSPTNVRVADIEAPARVYPGDDFGITAYVQASGMAGKNVSVRLMSSEIDQSDASETLEDETSVSLSSDGQIVPVRFEVTPASIGRKSYVVRVTPPAGDLDPSDNEQSAKVQVVEKKNRVLLVAGGPTREYRFLRNLLYRDDSTTLHVYLQTASSGTAQEANDILFEFPDDAQFLFEYDCIVAFDPDWRRLSKPQVELIEQWVAEKAGGMIVVAGPVHTAEWARRRRDDQKLDTVKALYPVTFYGRGSITIQLGRSGSEIAWPLHFTDEGRRADFLRLDDSPTLNEQAWNDFPGVHAYHAVRGAKPGAKIYARFSDPETAIDGQLPVFMAGQFYGAGRVLYLGSGEMWRLRELDDSFFERFYTKLIRYASQGRLLRDSSRGVLLVDKERCLVGDTVTVSASLSDAQFRPLTLPTVDATIITPGGKREQITLRSVAQSVREGMYSAQFPVPAEGIYQIELFLPGGDQDLLTRDVRVRIPELEIQQPQRNDAALTEIAQRTGGKYYVGVDVAMGRTSSASVVDQLPAKDQETFLPGTPDKQFERRLMGWLLALICGVLSLEWLIRRLSKLA